MRPKNCKLPVCVFHSRLKTYQFNKSFPPYTVFSYLRTDSVDSWQLLFLLSILRFFAFLKFSITFSFNRNYTNWKHILSIQRMGWSCDRWSFNKSLVSSKNVIRRYEIANQGFRLEDDFALLRPTNSTVSFSHIVQPGQQVMYTDDDWW